MTLPSETEPKKATRSRITEEEFFKQLQRVAGPEAVDFARWVLDNAEDHNLQIDWGDAGLLLKYVEPTKGKFFTFGQMRRDGGLATNRLAGRFEELGLPFEIYRDYLDEVAQLIPNASRKRFTTKTGRWEVEQISYGKNPSRFDYPPFVMLAPYKEKFMVAIDKAIQRIEEVTDNE